MTRPGDFEVTLEPLPGGGSVAHVEGELDLATSEAFENALVPADLAERLVIDLSRCTFLDSSAVRALLSTARAAEEAGGEVALVVPDPALARILEIAAVDTMFPVHPSLEAAL